MHNDTNKLKELAERAHKLGRWYWNPSVDVYPDMVVDQDFMLAANPKAILGLIAEVERMRIRLEISDKHPYDGIDTRNATIEGLERLIQGRWREEVERLKAENEALRQIVSECATACGAGCSPECTLEFMAMLPDEIASVVGKRARNATIGAVVWQFIDRMNDVCLEDPAGRILSDFLKAVRPAIDAALEGGGR